MLGVKGGAEALKAMSDEELRKILEGGQVLRAAYRDMSSGSDSQDNGFRFGNKVPESYTYDVAAQNPRLKPEAVQMLKQLGAIKPVAAVEAPVAPPPTIVATNGQQVDPGRYVGQVDPRSLPYGREGSKGNVISLKDIAEKMKPKKTEDETGIDISKTLQRGR